MEESFLKSSLIKEEKMLQTFRVAHISDTYGRTIEITKSTDLVIHSGGMFPNISGGNSETEVSYQEDWCKRKIRDFQRLIGNRTFLFIRGHKDFFNPELLFREHGLNAFNIEINPYFFNRLKFCGFPYVPKINGKWNFECSPLEMATKVRAIPSCDVLVSHVPPKGFLSDEDKGNASLTAWLEYEAKILPKYIFSGFDLANSGIVFLKDIAISNAAGYVHHFDILNLARAGA